MCINSHLKFQMGYFVRVWRECPNFRASNWSREKFSINMEFQRIHPFNIPLVKISVDASLLFKRGGQLCRLQSGGKESSWNYTRVLRHAYITRGTILLLPLFNNQLRPLLSKLISLLVYFPSFRVLRLHITGVSHVLHYHATTWSKFS